MGKEKSFPFVSSTFSPGSFNFPTLAETKCQCESVTRTIFPILSSIENQRFYKGQPQVSPPAQCWNPIPRFTPVTTAMSLGCPWAFWAKLSLSNPLTRILVPLGPIHCYSTNPESCRCTSHQSLSPGHTILISARAMGATLPGAEWPSSLVSPPSLGTPFVFKVLKVQCRKDKIPRYLIQLAFISSAFGALLVYIKYSPSKNILSTFAEPLLSIDLLFSED